MKTQLNSDKWRSYLTQYWDQQLPDLIQYGFPLDFDRNSNLVSTYVNHTSAIEHEQHIDQYIAEELNMVLCMALLMILLSLCMFLH